MTKLYKILITATLGVTSLLLTGCGRSNPILGEWVSIDFHIENYEIVYNELITYFTENEVTTSDGVFSWRESEDGNHLIIDFGIFDFTPTFNLDEDVLTVDGEAGFRRGSAEFEQHRQQVANDAENELVRLTQLRDERIAEEERLAAEEAERLMVIAQFEVDRDATIALWETTLAEMDARITSVVYEMLIGQWESERQGVRNTSGYQLEISENGAFSYTWSSTGAGADRDNDGIFEIRVRHSFLDIPEFRISNNSEFNDHWVGVLEEMQAEITRLSVIDFEAFMTYVETNPQSGIFTASVAPFEARIIESTNRESNFNITFNEDFSEFVWNPQGDLPREFVRID